MPETFFGFKKVDEKDKAQLVKGVFSSVASSYDVMNDAMSLGVHRLWKRTMVNRMNVRPGAAVLDVAGGTGDIAFTILKAQPGAKVTICDINPEMLEEGKKKSLDRNIKGDITWVCGDAENLPFDNRSFDFYTIAFGIRNVTHIEKALQEAHRVLKPGGRFLCLEFSHVTSALMSRVYDFYSFNVIPKLGKALAGDSDSYQYLVESIRTFPDQQTFAQMIEAAGFSQVKFTNLTQGVVALHSGWKV